MTPEQALDVIRNAILDVAPDTDPNSITGDVDFRQALAIDSMDFLDILETVASDTGIEVPEADYPKIITLAGFAAYLS